MLCVHSATLAQSRGPATLRKELREHGWTDVDVVWHWKLPRKLNYQQLKINVSYSFDRLLADER